MFRMRFKRDAVSPSCESLLSPGVSKAPMSSDAVRLLRLCLIFSLRFAKGLASPAATDEDDDRPLRLLRPVLCVDRCEDAQQ
jgi:hypothetical protein